MTNKDIFEAFHETLLSKGDNNNTWWLFNEDKTALVIYTESEPSNINRLLIEREGDKYIDIDKVKQAREEMNTLPKDYEYALGVNACLEILDRLIESEG